MGGCGLTAVSACRRPVNWTRHSSHSPRGTIHLLAMAKPWCPPPPRSNPSGTVTGSESTHSTSSEARTTELQCRGGAWIQTSPGVLPTTAPLWLRHHPAVLMCQTASGQKPAQCGKVGVVEHLLDYLRFHACNPDIKIALVLSLNPVS